MLKRKPSYRPVPVPQTSGQAGGPISEAEPLSSLGESLIDRAVRSSGGAQAGASGTFVQGSPLSSKTPPVLLGPSYISSYDSLRALALIGVSLYHLVPQFLPGGFLGVVLFFVFAGFLTARSMLRTWTQGRPYELKQHYARRFLKLYPPMLLLILSVLFYSYFAMPSRFDLHRAQVPSLLLGYNNYYQTNLGLSYFDQHGRFDAFTHLWALSIEWQFYLIFPLLCVTLKEKFRWRFEQLGRFLLLLGFASYLYSVIRFRPGVDPTPIYYSSLARLYQFLVPAGFVFSFMAYPRRQKKALHPGLRYLIELGLFALLIASFFFFSFDAVWLYSVGFPLYTLAALAFLYLARNDQAPFFLKGGFWSKIVARSYSLYLWQYTTQILLQEHLAGQKTSFGMRLFLSLLLWIILGEISYLLSEGGLARWRREQVRNIETAVRRAEIAAGRADASDGAAQEKAARRRGRQKQAAAAGLGILLCAGSFLLPNPGGDGASTFDEEKLRRAQEEGARMAASQEDAQALVVTSSTSLQSITSGGEGDAPATPDPDAAAAVDPATDTGAGEEAVAPETPAATTLATDPVATVPADPLTGPFTEAQLDWLKNLSITAIGDSVLAMAEPDVRSYLPQIYLTAAVSRQMWEAPGILNDLNSQGQLGDIVIIALGTNGPYGEDQLARIASISGGRTLVFVNSVMPNSWEDQVNQALNEFVAANDNAYLVDWYRYAKERTDLLYDDFTHPVEGTGTTAYANLICWKLLEVGKQVQAPE